MKYMKLGCRWGTGKPLFYKMLVEQNIVIGTTTKNRGYEKDDIILLADGYKALGIAKVSSDQKTLESYPGLTEVLAEYRIELDPDYDFICDALIVSIPEPQRFEYHYNGGMAKIGDRETIRNIEEFLNGQTVRTEETTELKILKSRKQIILQGAPGTGKTYATKELALRVIGEQIPPQRSEVNRIFDAAVERGQIAFCSFHQSMDYEEFVEGYKPSKGEDSSPTFTLQDGVFKLVADRARGRPDDQKFDEAWQKLLDQLGEMGSIEAETLSKKKPFYITMTESGGVLARIDPNGPGKYPFSKAIVRRYLLDGDKNVYNPSYVIGVGELLAKKFNAPRFRSDTTRKPHVLIIDEINRGNVSKIFGELITLLEADKREAEPGKSSESLSATLTYSRKKFTVPYNLYIIGTMNTADRSLGQIDYALRRRFAFYTIPSCKDVITMHYQGKDTALKEKAEALYVRVREFFAKPDTVNQDFDMEDVMVGHSYFMADSAEDFQVKMRYELVPLLEEYRKDGILVCQRDDLEYQALLADLKV